MKTKKKVYIVTSGIYSDYHIEGVFSVKAKAEKFARHLNVPYRPDDGPWIEAWEVDPYDDMLSQKGFSVYYVKMKKSGDVEKVRREIPYSDGQPCFSDGAMEVWVRARHRQHAIKIANEIRTQLIATDRWRA